MKKKKNPIEIFSINRNELLLRFNRTRQIKINKEYGKKRNQTRASAQRRRSS